jgi:methionyl-tRNA synthetase
VAACDRYINDHKPWALAKDPALRERLKAVLGTAIDALTLLSVVGNSVLPEGSSKLRAALGFTDAKAEGHSWPIVPWSEATRYLAEGSPLGEVPRLYPRLELPRNAE